MQWITILLIGVAANIDNLGISVAYGLKSNKITFLPNLLIAVISMICAFVSITAGNFFSLYFSQSNANFVGGSLVIGLGFWVIFTSPSLFTGGVSRKSTTRQPILPKLDQTKNITWKEAFFLGVVLAINCLAIGFGAGFTGVPPLFTSISIGTFSIISIFLGVMLGNKIGNTLFGRYSAIISGLLLIIIGVYEIII